MNWDAILNGLWQIMNSVPAVMLMAAILGWLLTKLFSWKPAWETYEGTIISAIKHAEKAIPDDTPNGGLAKLDAALRFVLNAYAEANNGKQPSAALVEQIKSRYEAPLKEILG